MQEVVVLQEVKVFVEVDVLPDGVERPPPLFKGGQSIHQWWAGWMSGAYETPAGIRLDGRLGTVLRSIRENNSVSKHAAMPECQK